MATEGHIRSDKHHGPYSQYLEYPRRLPEARNPPPCEYAPSASGSPQSPPPPPPPGLHGGGGQVDGT
eukprot:9915762-Alexandrium_andersonii.AAC.1